MVLFIESLEESFSDVSFKNERISMDVVIHRYKFIFINLEEATSDDESSGEPLYSNLYICIIIGF